MIEKITGWAAWHHVKGFDGHHYEGPVVYADLDDALLADIADLNDSEPYGKRAGWHAVKVEVRKVP
jgi:hypothetical protein